MLKNLKLSNFFVTEDRGFEGATEFDVTEGATITNVNYFGEFYECNYVRASLLQINLIIKI